MRYAPISPLPQSPPEQVGLLAPLDDLERALQPNGEKAIVCVAAGAAGLRLVRRVPVDGLLQHGDEA